MITNSGRIYEVGTMFASDGKEKIMGYVNNGANIVLRTKNDDGETVEEIWAYNGEKFVAEGKEPLIFEELIVRADNDKNCYEVCVEKDKETISGYSII